MDILNHGGTLDDILVPHISKELAEHLKNEFSADRQIASGILSDTNVVRSESYLLGFLAGLGYSRQVIDAMVANQEAKFEEDTLVDVTDSFLSN